MKPSVLMLGWELPPKIAGGMGVACQGLLEGLAAHAMTDVTFLLPRLYGTEDRSVARLVPVLHSLPTPSQASVSSYSNGGTAFSDHDMLAAVDQFSAGVQAWCEVSPAPSIVHAHDWLTIPAAINAKRRFKCPLVVHIHSTEFDRAGRRPSQRACEIEAQGLMAADRIIAVSRLTRDTIVDRYGIDASKIDVAYNGVSKIASPAAPRTRDDDQPLVSFIGRITYQKGPRHFIEAARIIRAHRPETRFVMAGRGDLLALTRALAFELGLRDCIDFPGFLSAAGVADLLMRSHVYAMPSMSEPLGIGALEAALAVVPTVVSTRCGVTEVLPGLLEVAPADPQALAEAVLSCLSDQTRAADRAQIALAAAKGLTWTRTARQVLSSYERSLHAPVS